MHTAFELKKSMFTVSVRGEPVDRDRLLDWERRDRLGVIIDRPVGALGATLLTLLSITAFYDVPGLRRRSHPLYPDIFLFHAGGPWGPFTMFDYWPDHKEIFVDRTPREMLRAINNRGITHLALPDRSRLAVRLPFKEPEAAYDRIKQCYVYDVSGRAADGDVLIESSEPAVMRSYRGVMDIDSMMNEQPSVVPMRLQSTDEVEKLHAAQALRRRSQAERNTAHPAYQAALHRIEAAEQSGRLVETLRRVSVAEALEMLSFEPV